MMPGTPWERGRFGSANGPRKILFGRMYEDTEIELSSFRPGGRIFCIASAGCTAMKLSRRHEVVAVDVNLVQLAYAEERIAGAPAVRGAAELVMGLGRTLAPLLGWSRARVRNFLALEDPAEQSRFFQQDLETWRFRAAFDALFSVAALRSVYAAPFLDFLPRGLGAVLRRRMERCFARHANRTNPYASALLLGESEEEPQPPVASRIRLVCADAAGFLEREPAGSFDGFTLSNILDGADRAYRQRLFTAVRHAAAPGATAVLRSFAEPAAPLPGNRAAEDRSMLWGIVDVRAVSSG